MPNKSQEYFFVDIQVSTKKIVGWGISETATLTGETSDKEVHRVFLTKGQYHKLKKYLD